ncbi:MAG: type I toxin-antitoxin system SymE family toxin [Lachnospiraceae bacterium]|nr:type I toxin-antitoxin system SymE family toxin [Lachnospiraceae bacterium]
MLRAGFNAGDKITVDCQQGRLVITKDEPQADTRTG